MKHFTASVYIVDGDRLLLIDHPKLGLLLPPGGHLEANETPVEAAHREVLADTGRPTKIASHEHLTTHT